MKKKRGRYIGCGLDIDKKKVKIALIKRDLIPAQVSRENHYTTQWLSTQICRGHISRICMQVLEKYGITEEEIRA